MQTTVLFSRILCGICLLMVGCSTSERPPTTTQAAAESPMEVPVIPDELASAQLASPEATGAEIQERGVSSKLLGQNLAILNIKPAQALAALPGEFAFRTTKGYYVTALDGGGRTADPVLVTASVSAGAYEKFRIAQTYPNTPHDKSVQTGRGNYLTAMNAGGLTAGAFHTDATQAKDWERFRLLDLSVNNFAPSYYALQTFKGSYVTAVGAGGKYADAVHTDATQIKDWEKFRVVKCGDLGSGFDYGVLAANGSFLKAELAAGGSQGDLWLDSYAGPQTRFKFIRQSDGTYALQTSNGANFVTALGGGGQVQKYQKCDVGLSGACLEGYSTIFHTDAKQVQAWEKFRVIDQGNCTYALQTTSSFVVGIYKDSGGRTLLTTRRDGASTANEKFQLVVYGLASPPVFR
jgi:hypothetical protein